MALFRYLCPVGDSSHGSVSQSVPHGVRAEVNKEMSRSVEKRGGRRGSYLSVSAEKEQVATYASTHSVRTAIKHFSKAFGKDLKEMHRGLSYCTFPLSTPARLQNQHPSLPVRRDNLSRTIAACTQP